LEFTNGTVDRIYCWILSNWGSLYWPPRICC